MGRRFETSAEYYKLIQSKRWRALRALKLSRDPICERCKAAGLITPAVEVHHSQPIESAGDLDEKIRRCYSYELLVSVCKDCHIAIHAEINSHSHQAKAETVKAETDAMIARLFHE